MNLTSDIPQPASDQASDLAASLLRCSAWGCDELGRAIPLYPAALAQGIASSVTSAMSQALGAAVSLREAEASNALEAEFACVIGFAGDAERMLITLDQAAARALANALIRRESSLQAPASARLTAAERGGLEYLLLLALEAASRSAGAAADFRLERIGADMLAKTWAAGGQSLDLAWELRVAGLAGDIRIRLRNLSTELRSALAGTKLQAPSPRAHVQVQLALPFIPLDDPQIDAIEPGDVLLPGAPDPDALAANSQVVTDTHWELGPCAAVSIHPTHVQVTFEARQPAPIAIPEAPGLGLRLGSAELDLAAVAAWHSQAQGQGTRSLSLPLGSPAVSLWRGPCQVGTGEWVRVEGELGIRVLEWTGGQRA